jgi:glycosyltransferase involved in cell wall biosynthesis
MRVLQYMEHEMFADAFFEFSPLLGDGYLQSIYAGKRISPWMLMRAYAGRIAVLRRAHRFDLLWIEKELFPNLPSFFEWLLARLGVPYIVDYDDAIFHNYDRSRNPLKRLLRTKIAAVMRHAALVVSGNPYLAGYARSAGAQNIQILPTVVDAERYIPACGNNRGRLVIGWMGSPTSARFLAPVLPVLERLSAEFPIEFAVVGASIDAERYPFVRCRPWSEATEAAEIGRFDVGIMPLFDDCWERGKCGYKLIQYMACAKPVVASPVGVNSEIVADGRSGFLANDAESWHAALSRLLTDRALRESMGRAGRSTVENRYCIQVTAPRLRTMMHDAAGKALPVAADA